MYVLDSFLLPTPRKDRSDTKHETATLSWIPYEGEKPHDASPPLSTVGQHVVPTMRVPKMGRYPFQREFPSWSTVVVCRIANVIGQNGKEGGI